MKTLLHLFAILLFSVAAHAEALPYVVYRENGKVGLKDENGKVVIPAEYEALGWSSGHFSLVSNVTGYRSHGKWGLISTANRRVTRAEFEDVLPGDADVVIVRRRLGHSPRVVTGCVNSAGKEVIPFLYDGIEVHSLRAIVFTKIGNQFRYGLIDLGNKTLIPQQFQEIRPLGTLRYAVRNFDGKTAIYSDYGQALTAFDIDSISTFTGAFAVVYQGARKGLIDRAGQLRLETKYHDIEVGASGAVRARMADEWFFVDGNNQVARSLRADSVIALDKGLYKVRTGATVTLQRPDLTAVTPSLYSDVKSYRHGRMIYRLGNLSGVIDRDGKVIVPALYSEIHLGENFILAGQGKPAREVWVLFDASGNRPSGKGYEAIRAIDGNHFAVKSRNAWGVLDRAGREVVSCTYDSLIQFTDSHIVVKFRGLYGIISAKDEWVVPPGPERLRLIGGDRYLSLGSPTLSLRALKGSTIYFTTNPVEVHDGFLIESVSSGERWKIDYNGVIVDRQVPPLVGVDGIFDEAEGYRAILRNGKYGFVDSRGRLRIANRYEAVQPFSEGMAAVKILGKWGFINTSDNIAVQPTYDEVQPYRMGYALVRQKGLHGLVDRQGRQVLPVRYGDIRILPSRNLLIETAEGLQGLADAAGKILIQPRYQKLIDCNGFAIVAKDGRYGVVSHQGLNTVPMIYDYIGFDPHHNIFLVLRKAPYEEFRF